MLQFARGFIRISSVLTGRLGMGAVLLGLSRCRASSLPMGAIEQAADTSKKNIGCGQHREDAGVQGGREPIGVLRTGGQRPFSHRALRPGGRGQQPAQQPSGNEQQQNLGPGE